ncbi:MAG: S41 family peptidase [Enhygromyxa sp.]
MQVSSALWLSTLGLALACAASRSEPSSSTSSLAQAETACAPGSPSESVVTSAPTALADDLYLRPEEALGSPYCLDPDSTALREILTGPKIARDATFEPAALAADVDFFHRLLQRSYAAYPEMLQRPGFDVGAFFVQWQERVAGADPRISFEVGFLQPLIDLKRAHRDNHLQVAGWGLAVGEDPELKVTEFLVDAEVDEPGRCEVESDHEVFKSTIRAARRLDGKGVVHPVLAASVQGPAEAPLRLRCGGQSYELWPRTHRPRKALDGPVYEWSSHGDTAVIVVRRLWGSPQELELLEQIAKDYPAHRRHRRIVFDFRGNGGGNDGYIYAWVNRAYRGVWEAWPVVAADVGPCGMWNSGVASQLRNGLADEFDWVREREQMFAQWEDESPSPRAFSGLVESKAEHPYEGKVFVLVDRDSASSGESGPLALDRSLGATMIGERTGGYLEYGNLNTYVLPHTGIVVSVPSVRAYHFPPAEGVGIEVDLYLDEEMLDRPAAELIDALRAYDRSKTG